MAKGLTADRRFFAPVRHLSRRHSTDSLDPVRWPVYNSVVSQPDYIPVGPSVRLISLPALARALDLTINQVVLALNDLKVPRWSAPEGHEYDYCSLPALEIALYRKMHGSKAPSDKMLLEEMEAVGRSWADMDQRRMRAAVVEFGRLLREGEPVLPTVPR